MACKRCAELESEIRSLEFNHKQRVAMLEKDCIATLRVMVQEYKSWRREALKAQRLALNPKVK